MTGGPRLPARSPRRGGWLWHAVLGAAIGAVVLHPLTMALYWFEFHPDHGTLDGTVWSFVVRRLWASYTPRMLAMSALFGALGAAVGLAFGLYHRTVSRWQRAVAGLATEMGRDVASLIAAGEGPRVEFKATLRWDLRQGKVNKALEAVAVKTVAGFLNHEGGSLLVGVADDGGVVGLERDYGTLKKKDRDGFQLHVMSLVKDNLGGDHCPLVHVTFAEVDGRDVCRVVVEPGHRPAYVLDRGVARYFLRAGNATRELDVREALAHVDRRFDRRPRRRTRKG